MELVDQRFFCSAFACGSIGGGMDTAGFAVIFLPSSGSQAIFLDVGAATFLATQHMHYPYRTETPSAVRIIPLPPASLCYVAAAAHRLSDERYAQPAVRADTGSCRARLPSNRHGVPHSGNQHLG